MAAIRAAVLVPTWGRTAGSSRFLICSAFCGDCGRASLVCRWECWAFPSAPSCCGTRSVGAWSLRRGDPCGTGTQPGAVLAVIQAIVRGQLRRAKPGGTTPLVQKLSFGAYNRKFAPNRTRADWLCADEEALDRYCADPLCLKPDISAALFLELLSAMRRTGGKRALASWNRCPILLLSGADDPVGAMGSGVKGSSARRWNGRDSPCRRSCCRARGMISSMRRRAAPPRRCAAAFCASAKRYWRSRRSRGINRLRRNRGAEVAPFPQKPETRRKLL